MEDIEDMFKNEGDQIESRLPDAKRKIVKKAKVIQSKKKEELSHLDLNRLCLLGL